jgi:hypothetical protein
MPRVLDLLLRGVLAEIEPTSTQKDGAQRSHRYLRDLMNTGQMANRIQSSYLSGSYARDTAIRPLDDVDIIFEIDQSHWSSGFFPFNSMPRPDAVLESFAAAVRRRYAGSSVYIQRRSIRLELYHLNIDVVPAIPNRDDRSLINIPDRDADEWIRSSPQRHSENATRVNKRCEGRFKPLVKLLKFWNSNLPDSIRCKSFLIETIAVRLFGEVSFFSMEGGLLLFWDFLASRYSESPVYNWRSGFGMSFGLFGVSVPDAVGTGSNTAARLDNTRAKGLAAKARISRDRLLTAQNSRADAARAKATLSALRA